jgi:hypothetical protein
VVCARDFFFVVGGGGPSTQLVLCEYFKSSTAILVLPSSEFVAASIFLNECVSLWIICNKLTQVASSPALFWHKVQEDKG